MAVPFDIRAARKAAPRLLVCAALALLPACADHPHPAARAEYRLDWTATRVADHAPLVSVAMDLPFPGAAAIRTDSVQPQEARPAFPRFSASLSPTHTQGTLELVARASLREIHRNKKGKLRKTKRNIGALIPIRPGETQTLSAASDPVHLEVRLERK